MPRTVFFSFHYQRDIMRVQVVKQHHMTKDSYTAAGFFDGSLEEKSKKEGDESVMKLINQGLIGSTVLCVLIGKETYTRRWVDYEIFKAVERGMGVFGVKIHGIPAPRVGTDQEGQSPFAYLGYGRKNKMLHPMIKYESGWKDAPYQKLLSPDAVPYLKGLDRPVLSSLFQVYDWESDDGFTNFGTWVEAAAEQAAP